MLATEFPPPPKRLLKIPATPLLKLLAIGEIRACNIELPMSLNAPLSEPVLPVIKSKSPCSMLLAIPPTISSQAPVIDEIFSLKLSSMLLKLFISWSMKYLRVLSIALLAVI